MPPSISGTYTPPSAYEAHFQRAAKPSKRKVFRPYAHTLFNRWQFSSALACSLGT